MNDHLAKPVVPVDLYNRLVQWLSTEAAGQPVDPAGDAPHGPASQPAATMQAALESIPELDAAAGLRHVRHDSPFYRRMLATFIDRHAADGSEICRALHRGDYPTARNVAHALKGIAGTLGMASIQVLAAAIEQLAMRSPDHWPADQAATRCQETDLKAAELSCQLERLVQALTTALAHED